MRGPPGFTLRCQLPIGIIPAYAGTTRRGCRSQARRGDHPRLRGDHYNQKEIYCEGEGSSPHVRGPRSRRTTPQPCPGIIPACAGTTCAPSARTGSTGDHPRMCGDHVSTSWSPVMPEGSSPHAWGHGMTAKEVLKNVGSSPHAWGPRGLAEGHGAALGIIPTRVGTTRCAICISPLGRNHPHTRGDHGRHVQHGGGGQGSSPHAWGPHRAGPGRLRGAGIIPTRVGTNRA